MRQKESGLMKMSPRDCPLILFINLLPSLPFWGPAREREIFQIFAQRPPLTHHPSAQHELSPSTSFVVVVESLSCVRLSVTLLTIAHQAPLSMGFSGKNTGVGCHFLFQGIFPTQGWNLTLLHCRQILYD